MNTPPDPSDQAPDRPPSRRSSRTSGRQRFKPGPTGFSWTPWFRRVLQYRDRAGALSLVGRATAGAVAGAVLASLFARGFPELAAAFKALSFLPLAVALFFLFVGLVQLVFGERANVLTQPGEQQLSLASCFFVLAFMTFVFVLVGTVAVMMPR